MEVLFHRGMEHARIYIHPGWGARVFIRDTATRGRRSVVIFPLYITDIVGRNSVQCTHVQNDNNNDNNDNNFNDDNINIRFLNILLVSK